jgi:AcrR family transcriptional regulator
VAAIAAEAGVSAQTVYANFENKRGLLQALMDQRVRGDAPAPPFLPPPGDEDSADPLVFLRQLAAGGRRLYERTAPIWPVVREAAASDPLIEAWWKREMERRADSAQLRRAADRRHTQERPDTGAGSGHLLDRGQPRDLRSAGRQARMDPSGVRDMDRRGDRRSAARLTAPRGNR